VSETIVFASDPTITFSADRIADLADKHGIGQTLMEAIICEAAFHYGATQWLHAEGYNGPDTLDKVEELAAALSALLAHKLNRHRLFATLFEESGIAAVAKFEELLLFPDAIRSAARKAHRRRTRGRPRVKVDLAAAYHSLVRSYGLVFPGRPFTNVWDTSDKKHPPIPMSRAAWFLFVVMELIDPHRDRLAEELRDLMGGTIKSLPGQRRGRPNLG
jgi:hypothetical protein